MKTIIHLILATIFIGFTACTKVMVEEDSVESPKTISAFQQYMLEEINFARTKPAEYAEMRLLADKENLTDNGSYLFLNNLAPLGSVTFNHSLNLSASNYALFLSDKNLAEHNADLTPLKRAIRAGFAGSSTGENIAIASENSFNAMLNPKSAAIGFVRILIIDKGVVNLGHRLILLSSKYTTVGIGYQQNSAVPMLNYVVQDFGNL